jgi:hypothetical protein
MGALFQDFIIPEKIQWVRFKTFRGKIQEEKYRLLGRRLEAVRGVNLKIKDSRFKI